MNFTKSLYEKTAKALPEITARTFSRYCGRSEGYYGSISAQNLNISTNSLLYLAEILECRRGMASSKSIDEVLGLIANEIARRAQVGYCNSLAVRRMIIRAVADTYMENYGEFTAPPIVIT